MQLQRSVNCKFINIFGPVFENAKVANSVNVRWSFPNEAFPIFKSLCSHHCRVEDAIVVRSEVGIGPCKLASDNFLIVNFFKSGAHIGELRYLASGVIGKIISNVPFDVH